MGKTFNCEICGTEALKYTRRRLDDMVVCEDCYLNGVDYG